MPFCGGQRDAPRNTIPKTTIRRDAGPSTALAGYMARPNAEDCRRDEIFKEKMPTSSRPSLRDGQNRRAFRWSTSAIGDTSRTTQRAAKRSAYFRMGRELPFRAWLKPCSFLITPELAVKQALSCPHVKTRILTAFSRTSGRVSSRHTLAISARCRSQIRVRQAQIE